MEEVSRAAPPGRTSGSFRFFFPPPCEPTFFGGENVPIVAWVTDRKEIGPYLWGGIVEKTDPIMKLILRDRPLDLGRPTTACSKGMSISRTISVG
ncbi:hypothetical protein B5G09_13565 [Alistipes sp. An54]|nr:hypothetical protein B5G09_13565 [Alistipes sp. An54]